MSVTCCPLEGCDDGNAFARDVVRRAAKEHSCEECGETIKRGDRYEYASGMSRDGGRPWTAKTCLSCVEIRKHFACNGWIYGQLWSDLEENFFPGMKAGGPCMEGLSPAAKGRLFERRMAWLEATRG